MKMRNEDLKKITEIKQYLLDPPISFKLNDYGINYLRDAIKVLTAYPIAANTINDLQLTLGKLQEKAIPLEKLRGTLINAGRKISDLTNR